MSENRKKLKYEGRRRKLLCGHQVVVEQKEANYERFITQGIQSKQGVEQANFDLNWIC